MTEPPVITPVRARLTDNSETVLRFAAEALAAGMEAALVTLVGIRGGAARPVGAQMAVREDGHYCGYVSGGCVENAAAFEALEVIRTGQDRLIDYGQGSPWFDIVLPCGGGITLAIHKLRSAKPLLSVLNALAQRQSATLRYNATSRQLAHASESVTLGQEDGSYSVCYRPQVRVVVAGGALEEQATAALAQAAGYEVLTLAGINPLNLSGLIDRDTAVILLYHDSGYELQILQQALAAAPFYIGALGSARTHEKRTRKLQQLGWSDADIARIHAPVGIFPKARDAHSLALSILAQIAAVRQSPT
ncbi:XdhC family protein [Yokenella regensburgei]|uniref:XdhC family protein n=1 Tax=Yokenella regensburgei TaxID=158877 RepID=UPI003F17DF9D